jgi:hypothetical protein
VFPAEDAADVGFGDHDRTQPARRGLISVGDRMRSAAASDEPAFGGAIAQDAIADPSNLQRLGTSMSEFCQRWDGEGYEIRVCFHSLTALLEHASPDVVFQFCHVLAKRLSSVDADAHFHVDPAEHSRELLETFESIFDATVDEGPATSVDDDGPSGDDAIDGDDAINGDDAAGDDDATASGEATDDDVHAVADEWGDEASYSIVGDDADRPDEVNEATDDEIADRLADQL